MFNKTVMRDRRRWLQLTQAELAERVGVNQQSIHKWESGAAVPRGRNIDRLAEALNVSPAALLPSADVSYLTDPGDTLSAIRGIIASGMAPEEKITMIEKLVEVKR